MNTTLHATLEFKTRITAEDRKRLAPHLSGYRRLNEILLLNNIPTVDIQKLILLELEGGRRDFILKKLVGRLKSKERRQLLTKIQSCLNVSLNPRSVNTAARKASSTTSSPLPAQRVSLTGSSSARKGASASSN